MIRINLIGASPDAARQTEAFAWGRLLCALLVASVAPGLTSWHWRLHSASAQLDRDLAAARQESARVRLREDMQKRLERRREELRARIAGLQQLRAAGTLSSQIVDHLGRSVSGRLWLTAVEQQDGQLTIEGRSPTLAEVSQFVERLGEGPLVRKPIEQVSSRLESRVDPADGSQSAGAVQFSVKAWLASEDGR